MAKADEEESSGDRPRRDLRLPPRTPRAAERRPGQRRRIVRIHRDAGFGICQAEDAVRLCAGVHKRDGPIHLCQRQRMDFRRYLQQRRQHKGRKGLSGAQQAVGMAVPSSVLGLPRSKSAPSVPARAGDDRRFPVAE